MSLSTIKFEETGKRKLNIDNSERILSTKDINGAQSYLKGY